MYFLERTFRKFSWWFSQSFLLKNLTVSLEIFPIRIIARNLSEMPQFFSAFQPKSISEYLKQLFQEFFAIFHRHSIYSPGDFYKKLLNLFQQVFRDTLHERSWQETNRNIQFKRTTLITLQLLVGIPGRTLLVILAKNPRGNFGNCCTRTGRRIFYFFEKVQEKFWKTLKDILEATQKKYKSNGYLLKKQQNVPREKSRKRLGQKHRKKKFFKNTSRNSYKSLPQQY